MITEQHVEPVIDRVVRLPEVESLVGLSGTTIWRMERKNEFPKRVRLSANAVGWKLSAIKQWLEQRPAA